jgi:copper transport protein
VAPVDTSVRLASGGTADVDVTPAKVGANKITVTVKDAQGKPANASQVTATLALPAEQIGPLPVTLTRAGPGEYVATAASLPRTGTWELVVRVQLSEFDRDVAQVDVQVR